MNKIIKIMKYLKKFDNHTEYAAAKQDLILPNVSLCAQENEVHYNPYVDPYNGHAYVDLDLPSGTKWATMNVGATSETDYGLYFAWGETQGYADASTKAFSWSDYKWTEDGGSTMSKYNATDGKTVLDLEDDAVAANWGGSWKTPTEAQFQELLDNTNLEWATVRNVGGYKFINKTDSSKYIFIPSAGCAYNGNTYNVGYYGYVWSGSLLSSNVNRGRYFDFSNAIMRDNTRCYGHSVRGVVG